VPHILGSVLVGMLETGLGTTVHSSFLLPELGLQAHTDLQSCSVIRGGFGLSLAHPSSLCCSEHDSFEAPETLFFLGVVSLLACLAMILNCGGTLSGLEWYIH